MSLAHFTLFPVLGVRCSMAHGALARSLPAIACRAGTLAHGALPWDSYPFKHAFRPRRPGGWGKRAALPASVTPLSFRNSQKKEKMT
jgi:hypothetical protein